MGATMRFARITILVGAGMALFQPASASPSEGPGRAREQPKSVGFAADSGEIRVRWQIRNRVKALVAARDFAALNALEQAYRNTRARTPSGSWKLSEFHAGLLAALPESDPGMGCAYTGEPIIKAWIAAGPNVPTPYIAAANLLVARAWCFRGEAYAGDVPAEAWAPFHENIAQAHAILTTHKPVASQDPEYYAVLEDIYRAEGREPAEFQQLMDEATAREPYYYPLYWRSYTYYQPQWQGSGEDIDAAARYAVERTRDEDGLGAYARYYWYASSCGCRDWVDAIDWEMMKLSMQDIAKRYPDAWNLASFAKFGCMFRDAEVARTYFDALGDDEGKAPWDDEGLWRSCRNLAYIGTPQ